MNIHLLEVNNLQSNVIYKHHFCLLIKHCVNDRMKPGQEWPIIPSKAWGWPGGSGRSHADKKDCRQDSIVFVNRPVLSSACKLNFPNIAICIASLKSLLYYNIKNSNRTLVPLLKGRETPMTKEQYIQKITDMMIDCNDIPLLDLICKLLGKSL